MFCKNCGKEVNENAKFCKYCGFVLEKNNNKENEDDIQHKEKMPIQIKPEKESRTIKAFLIFFAIVFIVIIVSIYYVSYFQNLKTTEEIQDNIQTKITENTKQKYNKETQRNITKQKADPLLSKALTEHDFIENKINVFSKTSFNSEIEKEKAFQNIVEELQNSADKLNSGYEDGISDESYIKNHKREFNNIGFNLIFSEGGYYFAPDYSILLKISNIPKSWKEYLNFKNLEKTDFEDGYCKLSTSVLVKRIIEYDLFIKKYPHFVSVKEIEDNLNSYLYSYLEGFDNDARYNRETNELKLEYRESIENFLNKYSNFSKYDVVEKYYQKLKNNNFKNSEEIKEWLSNELF